ncbi:MAG: nuclear transport factor 2 family protein [Halieaceae bacterium]|nr:nuclear transport factor 2 family protein [Halieaceae bacterium]
MQEQSANTCLPDHLAAIEAIRQAKARYFRGVDTNNADLVRSVLAEDCELDYRDCFVDPASGTDYFPEMSIVVRTRSGWPNLGLRSRGIVSVHQGHHADIEVTDDTTATVVWAMTDRIFMPAGAPYRLIIGYGHYHETYEKVRGAWYIKTLRISRLRVEAR